eukprot:2263384-Alexandrium_andersonii.AAC.1
MLGGGPWEMTSLWSVPGEGVAGAQESFRVTAETQRGRWRTDWRHADNPNMVEASFIKRSSVSRSVALPSGRKLRAALARAS